MTGLGSIIGSGWLFGALRTAQLAGAGAIYAWPIGGLIIGIIGLVYCELGSMLPETGGAVRYGYYSHGTLVGFVAAWSSWICIVAVIPVEAEASVQYMSSWRFDWAQGLYVGHELSTSGLLLAALLVIAYFLLNYWGVKIYAVANGAITSFKLVVPAITGMVLILAGFHPANFNIGVHRADSAFSLPEMLTAVATSGVVFSFSGFQSPINFAGEAKDPARNVPISVLASILLATIIYALLQIAFIGATPPALLTYGWSGVNFSSPFAQLALALNMGWLSFLLYADAFASPSGTAATYTATTARMIYAMVHCSALPAFFGKIDEKSGVPRRAMWLDLVVSFLFLFYLRDWGSLAAVISVTVIISYLAGPVSVAVLRRTAPSVHRPLRIPGVGIFAGVAFVLTTLLLYWARWPLTGEVIVLIALAMPIYIWAEWRSGWRQFGRQVKAALWILVYMPSLALVSYLGSPKFGGTGVIPYGYDEALVAGLGACFYFWAVNSGWRTTFIAELDRNPLDQLSREKR